MQSNYQIRNRLMADFEKTSMHLAGKIMRLLVFYTLSG